MIFSSLSKKTFHYISDSSSDTSSSDSDSDSPAEFYQSTQSINKITTMKLPLNKISSQTGINTSMLLKNVLKQAGSEMSIDPKISNLIAQATVLRMLPILKSAIEYSKLRNFPLSSEEENSPQIYISSLPTIPFSIINAENNAMMHIINEKENNKNKNEENEEKEKNEENEEKNENENDGKNEMRNNAGKLVKRQINDRDDEDGEVKNLVDHLTQCDGTFPLCNPSKIKKLPDGFEKMTNLNKKSSEVTVTDLLTALREDRVTDTYKLQSSYATAYIRRPKK